MPPSGLVLAIPTADRWLLAFALATLGVLIAGMAVRRVARASAASANRGTARAPRGIRRRAGVLIALGPLIGLATSPASDELAWVAVIGALGLAAVGTVADRRPDGHRFVTATIGIAAVAAVAAGVRLGPTGVGMVDVLAAAMVIALVTAASNGLGNTDGLGAGMGAAGSLAVFALAGFAGQQSLAGVAAGLGGACLAFLAFNVAPASLFLGSAGRLTIGYVLAIGALSAHVPIGSTGQVVVPLMLLGVFLLDAGFVVGARLVRQQSLLARRRDHLLHRLVRRHWQAREATAILVGTQLLLTLLAVFTGRGVLAVWLGAIATALLLSVVGAEAKRATFAEREPPGLSRQARLVVGGVIVALLVAVVPTVLVTTDTRALMEEGRQAAARALAAAREGDDVAAEVAFRQATGAFQRAHDKLDSRALDPGLLVPGLAPNLRAARTLADIGRDLARAGTDVTAAVDQDSIQVVDGRLPLDEVRRITPELERGAQALERALTRLRALDTPYLLSVVRDSLEEIKSQLGRAAGEATRAAAAARLAPAIFGGRAPRTYLLVVQNNAELRATGGLIGNWGLLTAVDGKVSVGELLEPGAWNSGVLADPTASRGAPADFEALFPFRPLFSMQDANLSPDFPTAARVLTNLAPSAGVPPLDGVIAVDPVGLAALLELAGPVVVPGWPTQISPATVVDVTLRDQYARFEDQTARSDFLGDVAKAVVDAATAGNLGRPARIAQVLGGAAHDGHLTLSFTRPAEQRLAEQLDVAGEVRPARSDTLGVYTQNGAQNKIDYYLERSIDYRVRVEPTEGDRWARVDARLTVRLANTAPDSGLPRIVIGPNNPEFTAGLNRSLVSVYTGLRVGSIAVEGVEQPIRGGPDAGHTAYTLYVEIPAKSTRTVELTLQGRVRLRRGGWYDLDLGHQPTIEPDRVQISVSGAPGWHVTGTRGLVPILDDRAAAVLHPERARRFGVRLAPAAGALDLWSRLEHGT